MAILFQIAIYRDRILLLTGCFARAAAERHSISRLWKQSSGLMARSVTQNAGDHGEHYITRDKKSIGQCFILPQVVVY